MFKSELYKSTLKAAAIGGLAITFSSSLYASQSDSNGVWYAKEDISGGIYYPIKDGATGPYKVNTQVYKDSDISKGESGIKAVYNNGRVPNAAELKAWDKDIDGLNRGLPEGSGFVDEGEALYEAQCMVCHGDFGSGGGGYPALSLGKAKEMKRTLKNNRWFNPTAEGPARAFGSYWPVPSTMWWYIRDAMPHTKSKTLTDDEVYSLTAYMLYINGMKVDGEIVDEDFRLDKEKFMKIEMPNRNGFVPDIDGPNGLENVREFYKNPDNFGGIKLAKGEEPCMSNCQETENIVRVDGGITDFNPPMSVERSLPPVEESASHKVTFDAKGAYESNCVMCHGMLPTAPVAGDKAAWEAIIKDRGSIETVYKNALEGTPNGMPAKGGSSLSDAEFKQVVDYMLKF